MDAMSAVPASLIAFSTGKTGATLVHNECNCVVPL